MPKFIASFTNAYAYPKATLPALEGKVAKMKCYSICEAVGDLDYIGFSPEDKSSKVADLLGSGEQVAATLVGEAMSTSGAFPQWCDAPSEGQIFTGSGYNVLYSFSIVYIDKPELQILVKNNAPHDLATVNAIRKALRNAAKLIGEEAAFPPLTAGSQCWKASDISAMQQWIMDNCGKFVIPDRINDATNLTKANVFGENEKLTIEGYAMELHEQSTWYFFCAELGVLGAEGSFGWSTAVSLVSDKPAAVRLGISEGDLGGERVCKPGDYVLSVQLKEIAYALEFLYGAVSTFAWSAEGGDNWHEGESDELGLLSWEEATADAEDSAVGDSADIAPGMQSMGMYIVGGGDSSSSTGSSSVTGGSGS